MGRKMARYEISGMNELICDMEQEADRAERLVPKMLQAGAEVVKRAQSEEVAGMIRSGKLRRNGSKSRSTGALVASIDPTPVRINAAGMYVDVYPQGADKKAVRNAEKGFLAEYGTSNMPSYPWMENAGEKAGDEAAEKMAEIWNNDE